MSDLSPPPYSRCPPPPSGTSANGESENGTPLSSPPPYQRSILVLDVSDARPNSDASSMKNEWVRRVYAQLWVQLAITAFIVAVFAFELPKQPLVVFVVLVCAAFAPDLSCSCGCSIQSQRAHYGLVLRAGWYRCSRWS